MTPFSGTSALAIAMMRLRTRCSAGLNSSVSTPSGTTCSCSGDTPKSSAMSAADVDDTVSSSGIRRATSFCISANPYHRRTSGLRHHRAAATSSTRSRVIGWCTVATTGSPAPAIFSRPVPRHWLSWTTSKSSRRSASDAGGAQAERLRLGEARRPRRQQLEQIDARLDLARPRDAERVGLAVQVQARHLGQPDPRVEPLGIGLARRTPRRRGRVRRARGSGGGRRRPARRNGSCSGRTTVRCACSAHNDAHRRNKYRAGELDKSCHAKTPNPLDMCPDYSLTC